MGNERLRSALVAAHVSIDAVSQRTGVDPKTVQRWLAGRTPHARHRWSVAELLGEEETYLWPEIGNAKRAIDATRAEFIDLYPDRSAVPSSLWWNLLNRVRRQVDILVYAAVFLHEQHPKLNDVLRHKAAAGCKVRILLGDPESTAVRARGAEERFGHGIETRCRVALLHYRPLIGVPGIDVHIHRTTLYNSIYRFDDELLANAHVWGLNAYRAPVLHVRRLGSGGLFDTYATSFEGVWATSEPTSTDNKAERSGED